MNRRGFLKRVGAVIAGCLGLEAAGKSAKPLPNLHNLSDENFDLTANIALALYSTAINEDGNRVLSFLRPMSKNTREITGLLHQVLAEADRRKTIPMAGEALP